MYEACLGGCTIARPAGLKCIHYIGIVTVASKSNNEQSTANVFHIHRHSIAELLFKRQDALWKASCHDGNILPKYSEHVASICIKMQPQAVSTSDSRAQSQAVSGRPKHHAVYTQLWQLASRHHREIHGHVCTCKSCLAHFLQPRKVGDKSNSLYHTLVHLLLPVLEGASHCTPCTLF